MNIYGGVVRGLCFVRAMRPYLCFLSSSFKCGTNRFVGFFCSLLVSGISFGITRGLRSLGGSLYFFVVCSLQCGIFLSFVLPFFLFFLNDSSLISDGCFIYCLIICCFYLFLSCSFKFGVDRFFGLFFSLVVSGIYFGITRGLCSLGGSLYFFVVCSLQFGSSLGLFLSLNLCSISSGLCSFGSLLRSVGSL